MPKDESSGLHYIREKVNKFIEYSIDNISYIRQDELDKFPETQNELSRVRQDIEDLNAVIVQARKEYDKIHNDMPDADLSPAGKGGVDDYHRGEHLAGMLASFEKRRTELKKEARILNAEVKRIRNLMSASTEMANKFRLALKIMGADMENLDIGTDSDAASLLNAYRIADRESASLARDLHDGPAQKLASAVLLVDLAERMVRSGDTERALEEFAKIKRVIKESLWDTRSFLFRLNPKGLEFGLDLALERFIDQLRSISSAKVVLDCSGDFSRLSLPRRSNLFKIIHQAIMNAIQKGKAQNVSVFLNGGRKNIKVRIIDDGVGFDVDNAVEIAKKRGSFGLINMEERTRIAGGTIRIDSSQGNGTHIYLDIPVPKEDRF